MKEILVGTYWMVANGDGTRAICQGGKPTKTENFGWVTNNPDMGWITIDDNLHTRAKRGDKILSKNDFQDLIFPEISYEESPIEIEIGKSGRVYTYDKI